MGDLIEFGVKAGPRKPRRWLVAENGCWLWQNAISSVGYGVTSADDGTYCLAHRWSYEQHAGAIPEGMQLDHLCRNRACVNPDHLEPVTQAENTRRGVSAKLTAEDVRAIRASPEQGVALARRYGVSKQQVSRIRLGLTWKDVA